MDRRTKYLFWISILSLLLITGFIVVAVAWPSLFDAVYKSLMVFSPGSMSYRMWLNLPVPLYFELYMFNWTNAENFKADPKIKPKFEEIGPFVFEESHGRVDIAWNDDDSTVTYNQSRTWIIVPEESADMSVGITNLNCVAMTIAVMSKQWDLDLYKKIANILLNKYESFFTTAPAEDWLFNGIEHTLLNKLNAMRNITEIPIPYDKFGWFYDRNGSAAYDGRFEMNTGALDLYEMGNLVRWNGMKRTHYYKDECAEVRGTAGEIMPPLHEFQRNIVSFAPDMCSYVSLNYSGEVTVEGLKGYHYVGDESAFDNGQLYPENRCFCIDECPPRGSRDVSTCKFGSPATVSFPHFYDADPVYTASVEGLQPSKDLHRFSIKIDPRTGIALEVQAAIQINFLLEPISWCDMYRDKPKIYIPLIWFRQRAKISPLLSLMVKVMLFFSDYGGALFFGIGAVSGIVYTIGLLHCRERKGNVKITRPENYLRNRVRDRFKFKTEE